MQGSACAFPTQRVAGRAGTPWCADQVPGRCQLDDRGRGSCDGIFRGHPSTAPVHGTAHRKFAHSRVLRPRLASLLFLCAFAGQFPFSGCFAAIPHCCDLAFPLLPVIFSFAPSFLSMQSLSGCTGLGLTRKHGAPINGRQLAGDMGPEASREVPGFPVQAGDSPCQATPPPGALATDARQAAWALEEGIRVHSHPAAPRAQPA